MDVDSEVVLSLSENALKEIDGLRDQLQRTQAELATVTMLYDTARDMLMTPVIEPFAEAVVVSDLAALPMHSARLCQPA